MTDNFLWNSINVMPIYIPLHEFSDPKNKNARTLLQLWEYLRTKPSNQFPLTYEQFTYLIEKNCVVFLFDGLDEKIMELSQQSINELMNNEIFYVPSILSCRKSFYEHNLSESIIQQRYTEKIELLPLEFTDSVKKYIIAFGKDKGFKKEMLSKRIIEAIPQNKELQDFAKNPLLLTMVLDIIFQSHRMLKINWSKAKLYDTYTKKWLKNEASKSDSKLRWNEKSEFLEEIAWLIYKKNNPASNAYDDEFYQTMKLTQKEIYELIETFNSYTQPTPLAQVVKSIPLAQIVEDICNRSLLIGDYNNYCFTHKSFQEYYIAKHIIKCMEKNAEELARTLKESTPAEIADFLEDILQEDAKYKHGNSLIADNLIEAYKRNSGESYSSLTIREHACYYLACMGTQKATQFLEQTYMNETNKWVQRGMLVGLGIFCNREDIIEKYIDMLDKDSEAASINIGFNLAYCGDRSLEEAFKEGFCDNGESNCDGLIRETFHHLRSEKYQAGWALDLFTLRTILQDKRRGIFALNVNRENIPFLNEFLSNDHIGRCTMFHRERTLLQEILANTNSKENYGIMAVPQISCIQNVEFSRT